MEVLFYCVALVLKGGVFPLVWVERENVGPDVAGIAQIFEGDPDGVRNFPVVNEFGGVGMVVYEG